MALSQNVLNALNLVGLALTSYGVMWISIKNKTTHLKWATAIAVFLFVILAFMELLGL